MKSWYIPVYFHVRYVYLDLLDLKLLLVIQRRGHTTKNGTPVDAMLGDTNCLCEGEVGDCEVL